MTNLWQRLKQRKLVQWAIAYVAFAFALIQGVDVVAQQFGWPEGLRRGITLALVLGFFVVLVLAWYHGERGAQRVTGTELLIIALLLAVGGGVLWRYSRVPATPSDATVARTASDGRVVAANNKTSMSASVEAALVPTAATPIAMQPIPAKSIAVLPFDNLNVGKKDAYFVAGMQDLILTKLADIGDLKVISRTSTMQYGSHPQNLTIVGRQLGVATLLEGSVQKAGNQVLINVQLIDAQSDSHIWAQSYQRTLKNVFGVEGEVAEQIATALKAKLSPAVTQRLSTALTSNSAANDLYLRAEYFTNQGDTNYDTAPWKQAIPLYKQAIARAPDFALARARLSCVESDLAWFGGGGEDVQQLRADARLQAEQALALAPNLAEAHLAIGFSDYYGRGDYAGALIAFAAALRLRPNDAMALAARGFVLRRQGHFEAAIAALEQAFAHDPRNTAIANDLGETYLMVSRYAEAEVTLQHALALDPDNVQAKLQYSNAILYA
ncbi:MAG: tetratricopeptide repeat protein, partial [Rhodanobacteraceae bacterium]